MFLSGEVIAARARTASLSRSSAAGRLAAYNIHTKAADPGVIQTEMIPSLCKKPVTMVCTPAGFPQAHPGSPGASEITSQAVLVDGRKVRS